MKKALLVGASGFVGRFLLDELLQSSDYDRVTIVVRKDLNLQHPKLVTLIGDYQTFPALKDRIEADEVFITLGTTRKKTPDRKKYYQVDHDYPLLATQIAKEKGARSVFLLTAVGSDPASRVFYVRTKGEVERDIIAEKLAHTHIFRPSMILGNRAEFRLWEKLFLGIWPAFDPILKWLGASKYRGIQGKTIARAMAAAARHPARQVNYYEWEEMMRLAGD